MSRYAIITDHDNLEIFLGFDEGVSGFFLTIEEVTRSDGEPESFLFHNMVHHPGVGMTFEQLTDALLKFGVILPPDLFSILAGEACVAAGIAQNPDGNAEHQVITALQMRVTSWSLVN